MKQVYQYRYYGEDANGTPNIYNAPSDLTKQQLITGQAFKKMPIYQLGIQTIPGAKVYINNPKSGEPIIIGKSGIFELTVNEQSIITAMRIGVEIINKIIELNNSSSNNKTAPGYLMIDIMYDEPEV